MDGADLILFNGKITTLDRQNPEATACGSACGIHGHEHVWGSRVVPSNDRAFWGALGCSCWAV
jgi:hypothetical protein